MRLITWNVNSIRSRLDLVLDLLEAQQPDVLALQETRCTDAQFPFAAFEDHGFEVAHHGSGGHGGVALMSRVGLDRVSWGFGGEHGSPFDEPRLVTADAGGVRVVSVYAPNGRRVGAPAWHFKLAWYELLRTELELELDTTTHVIICGDFNVCPTDRDVYDPVAKRGRNLVSPRERAALQAVVDLGFSDVARELHPNDAGFTWFAHSAGQFEKRRGYRLDLVLATSELRDRAAVCHPLLDWREPDRHPSDHAPLYLELADEPDVNRS